MHVRGIMWCPAVAALLACRLHRIPLRTPSWGWGGHRLRSNSLWTATFLHASHNLFIQAIFTPLTADTGPTKYAIDEFGFVLPIVIGLVALWCWRHRDAALAAWHRDT